MKKVCSWCGKVHEKDFFCSKKPKKSYVSRPQGQSLRREDIFRSSYAWKCKRLQIMKRDRYLCVACLNNLTGTVCRLTTSNLSVHHIKPLKSDFDLRLDDGNLITLCTVHHEMAENGRIPAKQLTDLLPPTPETAFF